MPCPAHPFWLDHYTYTWRRVQLMKLLIMQSAVRDCLFNIFAATIHTWRPSPPSATWGRAMPWWQGTRLTWAQTFHVHFIYLYSFITT
jgi:hypothetical protein